MSKAAATTTLSTTSDALDVSSVEEAGALLGAATTQLSSTISPHTKKTARNEVPNGMHSSFAIYPNSSTSLFSRLKSLRNLLTSHPSPLPSAPSLLAMLMKLLSASSSSSSSNSSNSANNGSNKGSGDGGKEGGRNGSGKGSATPATPSAPMTSHALRYLWVECVILCHELGKELSGKNRVDLYAFVKTMMGIASLNPKSAKAAGGTRLAALQCLSSLFSSPILSPFLVGFPYDMLILCHRGIKSSGHGDPLHRMYCLDLACAVLTCGRRSDNDGFLCQSFEERVLQESFKLLRKAIEDKYPEVRGRAATFAMILVSGTVSLDERPAASSGVAVQPLAALEELIQISRTCLDDESIHISSKFAEVFGRCICTSIAFHQRMTSLGRRQNHNTEGETGDVINTSNSNSNSASSESTNNSIFKLQQRRNLSFAFLCNSISSSLAFLAEMYLKADPQKNNGSKTLRYGYSLVILYFLKLQLSTEGLQSGEDGRKGMTMSEVLRLILNLVSNANDFDVSTTTTTSETDYYSIFRTKNVPSSETRTFASRILRGLVELSSEMVQLTILHDLIALSFGLTGLPLQVALSEISHLVSTLEEAVSDSVEKLLSLLQKTIIHTDYGVRLETCISYCAVVTCATLGNQLILQCLTHVSSHKCSIAEILSQPIPSGITNATNNNNNKRRFRLNAAPASSRLCSDSTEYIQNLKLHQCGIHGHALLLSRLMMVCNEKVEKDAIFNVVEKLIDTHRNGVFLQAKNTSASHAAISTCVRAGYDILSSTLTLGTTFIESHVDMLFPLWERSTTFGQNVVCIEAVLSSLLRFLQCCPDLVVRIPDALNRITLLLESHFRVICAMKNKGSTAMRLDMVKALLLECFSWLPYGSFPVVADDLFLFALDEIKAATEIEVLSSLLPTLVESEDKILDAYSPYRAHRIGQVIGTPIESHLLALYSNIVDPMEREMVYHSYVWKKSLQKNNSSSSSTTKRCTMFRSAILGIYKDDDENIYPDPPTPLHNTGPTWRQPPSPRSSSKIRLLDSAIIAFSSTFNLQDAQEQERVMFVLEELLPQHAVKGFSAALMSETEKQTKAKSQHVSSTNIITTILSCVYNSIPSSPENADNRDKKKSPPWMHKAKDVFFTLLSSQAFLVRRAAAEGLGWLASLGFSEEEQSLPSNILHSIDQVLKGNLPDGTLRKASYDSVVSIKAGALLALGSIQRCHFHYRSKAATSKNIIKEKGNSSSPSTVWSPPTMHMMTRVLATVSSTRSDNDSYLVRSYALHSMGLLIYYLIPGEKTAQEQEQSIQLIGKAVSLVDDNFFGTWAAISSSAHHERSREVFCLEPVFLSVLLRLINIIQPKFHLILVNDPLVINRFLGIVSTIIEISDNHPFIVVEGLAFLEKVSSISYKYQEKDAVQLRLLATCIPLLKKLVHEAKPPYLIPTKSKHSIYPDQQSLLTSPYCQNAILLCLQQLMESSTSLKNFSRSSQANMTLEEVGQLPAYLFALLEIHCSKTQYTDTSDVRSLLCSREVEHVFSKRDGMKKEILFTINFFVLLQGKIVYDEIGKWNQRRVLLHWLLLARELVSGSSAIARTEVEDGTHGEDLAVGHVVDQATELAASAASLVYTYNPPRWQVKSEACYVAHVTLSEMEQVAKYNQPSSFRFEGSASFNPIDGRNVCQTRCQQWISKHQGASSEPILPTSLYSISSSSPPESYPSLHLEDLITSACSASMATVDHAELPSLQNHGVVLLSQLVKQFGDSSDPDFSGANSAKVTILQQYSSQIVSSVKHSIRVQPSSEKQQLSSMITSTESEMLFMSGCNVLRTIVEKGLVNDPLVLRRLVRPLISLNSDLVLFPFPISVEGCKELKQLRSPSEDMSHMRLYRVGTIGTIASLCVSLWMNDGIVGGTKNSSEVLLDEMKGGVIDILAVHSAIFALDAARIIWKSDVQEADELDSDNIVQVLKNTCNLTFQTKRDISDTVEMGYIQYWPVLATFAVCHFMEKIAEKDDHTSEILSSWLNQTMPLLFLGAHDSLAAVTSVDTSSKSTNSSLSSEYITTCFLFGIRRFVKKRNLVPNTSADDKFYHKLKALVLSVIFGVLLPALGVSKDTATSFLGNVNIEYTNTSVRVFSKDFILQSCGALEDIYSTCVPDLTQLFGDSLLHVILIPLGILQAGYFDIQSSTSSSSATVEIIYSCIKCVCFWIRASSSQNKDESLLKSMVHLSLSIYVQKNIQKKLPTKIKDAVHDLFLECINKLPKSDKLSIAQEAARIGSWELWEVLCINVKEESAVSRSFDNLKISLSDTSNPQHHIPALIAIRTIVQNAAYGNAIICPLMHFVGVDVLSLLKMYGLNMSGYGDNPIHRSSVCADAMRILMLAYQQLHSATEADIKPIEDEKEETSINASDPLSDYLKILFCVLASVIDHNGLPNALKENSGSDVALGRMCAQAIVHIVRTSPLAFKSSIIRVPDRERGVLETAVRAEMTGHSASSSNKKSLLPKKKLNLKAFRK